MEEKQTKEDIVLSILSDAVVFETLVRSVLDASGGYCSAADQYSSYENALTILGFPGAAGSPEVLEPVHEKLGQIFSDVVAIHDIKIQNRSGIDPKKSAQLILSEWKKYISSLSNYFINTKN